MTSSLLSVENLVVDYGRARRTFRAIDDVSFTIAPGETLGLVGESGSGKSTIAKVLVGLAKATAGHVTFDGRDITHTGIRGRRQLAGSIQVVFQDPYSSLNPAKSIGQALAEPFVNQPQISSAERRERIGTMLERVGMPYSTVEQYPSHLSGGQRQRVAIARALMLRPRLVVCDEPVSALDLSIQAQILNLLVDLQNEFGLSYLFVAHNLSVVRHIADRVMVLYRGKVMEYGDTDSIYERPLHPYTRALLASEPVSDPAGQRARRAARSLFDRVDSGLDAVTPGGCVFSSRCPYVVDHCRQGPPSLENADHRAVSCVRHSDAALTSDFPINPAVDTVNKK